MILVFIHKPAPIYTPVVYWLERCPFKAEKRDRNPFGVPFVEYISLKVQLSRSSPVKRGKRKELQVSIPSIFNKWFNNFGLIVIMGAQGLCKSLVGVRSPVGPPKYVDAGLLAVRHQGVMSFCGRVQLPD